MAKGLTYKQHRVLSTLAGRDDPRAEAMLEGDGRRYSIMESMVAKGYAVKTVYFGYRKGGVYRITEEGWQALSNHAE